MENQRALELFTDRTESQLAFKQAYLDLTQKMPGKNRSRILTYYGIGGIGKSLLLQKLAQNLATDPEMTLRNNRAPLYVDFSFENAQDGVSVLSRLANILTSRYSWDFTKFRIGLYLYYKHIGEDIKAPESTTYMDRDPMVKLALDLASEIPVVGSVLKVFSYLDQGQAAVRNLLKQNDGFVKSFSLLSSSEQRDALPGLFAETLNAYTEKAAAPLVVLLDTYECIEERAAALGSALRRDQWIHGENGVISRAQNTLWVIAGRNRITWEINGCPIEQHLLGHLSGNDAGKFLADAGMPEQLIAPVYKLTEGLPLYLDICIAHYRQLVENSERPDISKFASINPEELIERYVRYLDKSVKELVYMLAFIPEWDEKLVRGASAKILGSFSLADFKRVRKLSITTQLEGDRYFIHRKVAEILRSDPENDLERAVAEFLFENCAEVLTAQSPASEEYAGALLNMMHAGLVLHRNRDDLRRFYEDHIAGAIQTLLEYRRFDQVMEIFAPYWAKAQENQKDLLYADALTDYSWYLHRCTSNLTGSLHRTLEALALHMTLLGKEDFTVIRDLHSLAIFLSISGYDNEAIGVYQYAIEQAQLLHPEEKAAILNYKRNLAISYRATERHKLSDNLFQEVLDGRREVLGNEHPATLLSMEDVFVCHWNQKKYDLALELGKEMVPLYRKVLKDAHPDTTRAMYNLISVYNRLWEEEAELALWKELLTMLRGALGEAHSRTLAAMEDYASILADPKEKEAVRKQIIALCSAHLGQDHPDTLAAMDKLAKEYGAQNCPQEELQLRQEILELRRAQQGLYHPDTLQEMLKIADIRKQSVDTWSEGNDLYYEVKDLCAAHWDDRIPDNIVDIKSLIGIYGILSDSGNKLRLQRELITQLDSLYGEGHAETLTAMDKLAENCYNSEKIRLRSDILTRCHKHFGPNHPKALDSLEKLADAYATTLFSVDDQEFKSLEQQLPLWEDIFRSALSQKSHLSSDIFTVLKKILNTCIGIGLEEQGNDFFRILLENWQNAWGERDERTLRAADRFIQSAFANSCNAARFYDQLLPAVNGSMAQAYAEYLSEVTDVHVGFILSHIFTKIAQCYSAADRHDEALLLLDKVMQWQCASGLFPVHPRMVALSILRKLGREAEAKELEQREFVVIPNPATAECRASAPLQADTKPEEAYIGLSIPELMDCIRTQLGSHLR